MGSCLGQQSLDYPIRSPEMWTKTTEAQLGVEFWSSPQGPSHCREGHISERRSVDAPEPGECPDEGCPELSYPTAEAGPLQRTWRSQETSSGSTDPYKFHLKGKKRTSFEKSELQFLRRPLSLTQIQPDTRREG